MELQHKKMMGFTNLNNMLLDLMAHKNFFLIFVNIWQIHSHPHVDITLQFEWNSAEEATEKDTASDIITHINTNKKCRVHIVSTTLL